METMLSQVTALWEKLDGDSGITGNSIEGKVRREKRYYR